MTRLFGIKDVIWWSFCFQNKDTITLWQAFLSIYILCKSDEGSCNILGYRNTHKHYDLKISKVLP